MSKTVWIHRPTSFAASLFILTTSLCQTLAFGQVIGESGDTGENAVMSRRTLASSSAIHPGFQNAIRLAWRDTTWIRDYAARPRLFALESLGRPATFHAAGLGSMFRFGSGRWLAGVENYHPSAKSRLTADPLVSDNWLGGNGNWSVGANWSGGVPNNGTPVNTTYDVFIDNGNAKASAVTLDMTAGINNLTIDSDDSLAISNTRALTINGSSIANAGEFL
jgi:hypothetical protein